MEQQISKPPFNYRDGIATSADGVTLPLKKEVRRASMWQLHHQATASIPRSERGSSGRNWHIATNRCALNFRSILGVLRTWMGERPRPRTTRMTLFRHAPRWIAASQQAIEPHFAERKFLI